MIPNKKGAVSLQKEIFLNGLRGSYPSISLDPIQLKTDARQKLSMRAFNYIDGGAGMEKTMLANRLAFDSWNIVPSMLRDVSRLDTSVNLFGHHLGSPFFLCPIGVLELAHKEADTAVAKACAATGMPMMISNQSSVPMEVIARHLDDCLRFFQLYWSKSDALIASFVSRAEQSGCAAIVVTLDTTLLGWRTKDLQCGFLPFLYGMGLAQYISDPVFNHLLQTDPPLPLEPSKPNLELIRALWQMAKRYPGSTWQNFKTRAPLTAIRKFIEIYMNPALQWDDLMKLRAMTRLPVILKGIQHPDDARKAADLGVEGIVVSNHGGRQVDGAIGSLHALAQISEQIGDRLTILFDSGLRSGADAFKALALGARAVGIGRPYAYALAVNGATGVKDLIESMQAEFELTMALAGCSCVKEITRDCLKWSRQ